ncbi:unnamed protein product [Chrysoparadoxa australica]
MASLAPARSLKPPEKGIFPLDHGGECKAHVQALLSCLAENGSDHISCKPLSREYLECRMKKDLMQQEDLTKLGFAPKDMYKKIRDGSVCREKDKERAGFVAGTHVKQRGGGKGPFDWFK